MQHSVSIIISSKNEEHRLRQTVDSMRKSKCSCDYEIILLNDGSTDGSYSFVNDNKEQYPEVELFHTHGIGIAPARNIGASFASGDTLIFCDAHILVEDGWLDIIADALDADDCDAVSPAFSAWSKDDDSICPKATESLKSSVSCGRTFSTLKKNKWMTCTSVEDTPILSGGCWAVKKQIFDSVGGYDSEIYGYGYDEENISLKLWQLGYICKALPDTCVRHFYRTEFPYDISTVAYINNLFYSALYYYNDQRVAKLRELVGNHPFYDQMYDKIFSADNIRNKRLVYQDKRTFDDDWFFNKFYLPL